MNCKPGDLALIIRQPLAGRLVEVMYAAPCVPYTLPDGHLAKPAHPNCWVVRSLGSPFDVPIERGAERSRRMAMYASCPDSALRPLPGEQKSVETEREVAL